MLLNGSQETSSGGRVAVIFAGGQSRRMQCDKALLPFDGSPTLAQFQYERLQPLFSEVYLLAKSNKFSFNPKLIHDIYAESSPMVGLASIWHHVKSNEVFVLSVDAPFITQSVIERLYQHAVHSSADAIIAQSPHGIEPLCAIYRRTSSQWVNSLLQHNIHTLKKLLNTLKKETVLFEEEGLFMNMNYPSDYQNAIERLKKFSIAVNK